MVVMVRSGQGRGVCTVASNVCRVCTAEAEAFDTTPCFLFFRESDLARYRIPSRDSGKVHAVATLAGSFTHRGRRCGAR